MLDRVSIAAPCSADWDNMAGTDQVRHCVQCDKNVCNLSAMTRRRAEAVLRETEGRLCARLYRRADGTILTENCPVGLRAIGRRISRFAGAAMSAIATLSSTAAAQFPMLPIPSALQEANSVLTGFVQDASGQGIPNAGVVVNRMGSEVNFTTKTDAAGQFRIDSLAMGSYRVRVRSSGFESFAEKVSLLPVQEYRLKATMLVGTMGGAAVEVQYAK
jgi:Carboxypeptidase regulatory-like domain